MDSAWLGLVGVVVGSALTGLWQWVDAGRRRRDAADARAAAFARELRSERRVIYARLLSDLRSFEYEPADRAATQAFVESLGPRVAALQRGLDDLYLVAGQDVLDAAARVRDSVSARLAHTALAIGDSTGDERVWEQKVRSAEANEARVEELAAAMRTEVTTDTDPDTQPR